MEGWRSVSNSHSDVLLASSRRFISWGTTCKRREEKNNIIQLHHAAFCGSKLPRPQPDPMLQKLLLEIQRQVVIAAELPMNTSAMNTTRQRLLSYSPRSRSSSWQLTSSGPCGAASTPWRPTFPLASGWDRQWPTPELWLLGQPWARNACVDTAKLAASCSFARVENAFVQPHFENFVCALEKLKGGLW